MSSELVLLLGPSLCVSLNLEQSWCSCWSLGVLFAAATGLVPEW